MKRSCPSSLSRDLESMRVIHSCPRLWEEMQGNDQRRFCGHCQLHVHNLSAMAPRQIQDLAQTPGPRCVAYFEEKNRGIRTLKGRGFIRRTCSSTVRLAASLIALIFPLSFAGCSPKAGSSTPPRTAEAFFHQGRPPSSGMIMGKIAPVTPSTPGSP